MDYITSLPKSDGYGTIMVVVNIFSKCATFMPAIVGCFKNVVKYWGLSRNIIIRDQDWKLLEGAI